MFYRVENANGVGPYNSDTLKHQDMRDDHASPQFGEIDNHPSPTFNGHAWRDEELSAFQTLDQLHKWFDGYLPELLADGYHIATYTKARVTYIDKYQVIIIPK